MDANLCLMILVVIVQFVGNASPIGVEDKCRIVKSVVRRYQTRCVFLLRPKNLHDLETESLAFKYFREFSREFLISAMIRDRWKIYQSREICQPFIFVFCNTSQEDIFQKSFTETTYRANTKWIVFEDAIRNENEFLKNSYIPLDTEFLLAKQPPDTKDVEISELFHVLPNTPLHSQTVGQWNLDTGLNWTNKSFSERRVDFHGSVIKATYAPFGKVLYFVENDKKLEFGGFAFEIWNTLENTLNFTTTFQKPTTGRFGAQSANGSWDGVTGMLQSKKVDMSLAPLILMNSRLSVIDYFVPVIRTRYQIYLKRPHTEEQMFDQVLKPLSGHIWFCLGLIMILISVLLTIAWLTSERFSFHNAKTKHSLIDSLFHVFGIFCQSGLHVVPKEWSIRLVIINTSVVGFFVYLAYSAMLFSFLAVRKYEMPFKNLKELINDGRYKLGLIDNSGDFIFFAESKDPVIKEAYKKLVMGVKNHPKDPREGIRRVCEEKRFAHLSLVVNEKHLIADSRARVRCSYVALPGFSVPFSVGNPCVKNSSLKRIINYYILKMSEGGLLKVFDERLIPLKLRKKALEDVGTVATMEKVSTIFIILVAGIISSIVVLFLEMCYARYGLSSNFEK